MKYEIDFEDAPERESTILRDGRRFTLLGYEAYVRKDGQSSTLLLWESECANCGERFETKTGMRSKTITKRCEAHRKMGDPATAQAAKRMKNWKR